MGPLMTSLDMTGFSLTLLEVDEARLEMLDAPTEVRQQPLLAALLLDLRQGVEHGPSHSVTTQVLITPVAGCSIIATWLLTPSCAA